MSTMSYVPNIYQQLPSQFQQPHKPDQLLDQLQQQYQQPIPQQFLDRLPPQFQEFRQQMKQPQETLHQIQLNQLKLQQEKQQQPIMQQLSNQPLMPQQLHQFQQQVMDTEDLILHPEERRQQEQEKKQQRRHEETKPYNLDIVPTDGTCSQIHKETNDRLWDRNVPSNPLQPYFSSRPVLTKYSVLPIVDPRARAQTKVYNYPVYNAHKTFNPGNTKGPWSGYSSQVNLESDLRNQVFALQRCNQAVYVPNSSSDLYQNKFWGSHPRAPAFPYLFKNEHFEHFDPNPDSVGQKHNFLNNTRMEYRDMSVNNKCE